MVLTYIRPDADDTDGAWTNESDSQTNLFASIDETVADDNDYIKSVHLPDHDICKIRLSDPSGMVMRPATVHYRYKKKGEAATNIDLTVSLLQGATTIASWSHSAISTSYVDGSQALSIGEFNSITDFTDLFLQFDASSGWWLANSSIDLDFANGLYYDSGAGGAGQAVTSYLSCTRSSAGYVKNSDGTLTSFASNALRIGTGTGLLVEDAGTNQVSPSSDFSAWGQVNNTVSTDVTTAPDGTSTADKVIPVLSAGNAIHRCGLGTAIAPASAIATWSVYAKQAGYTWISLDDHDGNRVANFDLSNGVVGTVSSGTTATIEALANGWYRCTMTGVSRASGGDDLWVGQNLVDAGTGGYAFSTGDDTSGVYLWGGQFELGAFVSSFIPTTGGAATRAADNITTSSTLQTVINAATGSLVAKVDNGSVAGVAANIVDSNGTNLLGFNASNNALASITATLATGNTANRTTQDKLGLAWTASARSLVLNGGTVAPDASSQTPSATQHIGSTSTTNFAYAYIERLTGWTTKLADATLQGFTT